MRDYWKKQKNFSIPKDQIIRILPRQNDNINDSANQILSNIKIKANLIEKNLNNWNILYDFIKQCFQPSFI